MNEIVPVKVPLENVNDDSVTVTGILVSQGDRVREGDVLLVIETSKAALEIEAPTTGIVDILVEEGQDIPVGERLCIVGPSLADIDTFKQQATADSSQGQTHDPSNQINLPPDTAFSKKALALLETLALNPQLFTGRKMVKEKDVWEVKESIESTQDTSETTDSHHVLLEGISLKDVTLTPHLFNEEVGRLSSDFLTYLQENENSFANKSSSEKCALYRQNGAEIGEKVTISDGSVVVAPQVILGAGATVSEQSVIRCRERFAMGALSRFGANLSVKCRIASIGDEIYAGINIRMGGGGNADPWAIICVGDRTYLGDDLFINVGRPVLIGRDVFLTQRSILVTHNIGHSILEGFENRFAPIVLEDGSQVGMNSTLYAGARIGRYAIVGSNSYVISSIPAGKMAMGVPAKVVSNTARSLSHEQMTRLTEKIIADYHQLLLLKGYTVSALSENKGVGFTVTHDNKSFKVQFTEQFHGEVQTGNDDELVLLTLACPPSVETKDHYVVVDLLSKVIHGKGGIFLETTREFLRKKGIRCTPGPWRYSSGLI